MRIDLLALAAARTGKMQSECETIVRAIQKMPKRPARAKRLPKPIRVKCARCTRLNVNYAQCGACRR